MEMNLIAELFELKPKPEVKHDEPRRVPNDKSLPDFLGVISTM